MPTPDVPPKPERSPPPGSLLFAALCGVLVSITLGVLVHRQQTHVFHLEIQAGAENRFSAIQRETEADVFMLTAVTGLMDRPENLTRDRFAQVSQAVQGKDRSHAISWLPRVDDHSRENLEQSLLKSGSPRPFIVELDPATGALVRAPRRAHYYPVLFSMPEDVGRAAFGFDVESHPQSRIAMRQASADRRPASTGPLRFLGDPHLRVAVYAPVWWHGQSDGPPNGFLAVGIRPDMMVDQALTYLQPVGLQIALIDETNPNDPRLLYRHASRLLGREHALTAPAVSRTMKISGRTWRIVCEPVMPPPGMALPLSSTAAGLLITLLLHLRLRRNLGKREHVEAIVRQRTEELSLEVAEHQRTEAQLAVARDEALEASRMKSEFLANVSHELRTPLNGVVGTTEMLLSGDAAPDQREGLSIIRESANSLLHLISDVLDSSRLESGGLRLEMAEFAPESVVEAALDIVADRAHRKGLDLAGWVEAPAVTRVRGDANRVRQVLLNLVSNAVKFTAAGSVIVRAWPKPDSGGLWRFEVRDTGIGIDTESQKLLFQRFVQLDGTSTRQFGGTGLGLAISRQLVELMGGQIAMHSQPGQGSTFWFEIPLPITSSEPPAERVAPGVSVVVDAGEATAAALRWWLGPGVVHSPGGKGQLLLAHASSPLYKEWQGARVRLRYLTDPVSEAETNTRILTCPVHRSRLIRALDGLSAAPIPAPPPPQRGGRILLVEDNAVNRRVAVWMLGRLGCEVHCAADGVEALEAMGSPGAFDAVLMDCQMPRMDGYAATRAIRELPGRLSVTPVIALTANAMPGDRELCIAAGMDDYLAKPLEMQALSNVLGRWIEPQLIQRNHSKQTTVVRS